MTAAEREELIEVLRELWDAFPDMRFGQLIVNVAYFAREPSPEAPWDVENAELLAGARALLKQRCSTVES